MRAVLLFFAIATLIGCALRVVGELRLRAVARRADATEGEICQLESANRVTSMALVTSLVGLVAVAVIVYLVA